MKSDFHFKRTRRLRAGIQDVLNAYKELCDRKLHDVNCRISSLFASVTADDKPQNDN